MNIPLFESFRRIEMKDGPVILAHNEKYSPFSSEYGSGCLCIYSQAYSLKYTISDDTLFVLDEDEECLYMPTGKAVPPETLKDIIIKYRQHIPDIYYGLFSGAYIETFPEVKDYFEITSYRDESEYLYLAEKLAELKEPCFETPRYLISYFKRHNEGYSLEFISSALRDECMSAAKLWTKQKDLEEDEDIIREHAVIERLFNVWDETGLEGIALKVGGCVKAFSVFSRLDKTTCVIHIEKFDRSIKGLLHTLNVEVAKYLRTKCKYINKEQDVGLEGLRYSKMAYRPEKLIDVYCLIPKF